MLISASRRTDIPAFHTPWLLDKLGRGRVEVVNPFNPRQVSTIDLTPAAVDALVLWTRDARPLLPQLGDLAARYPVVILWTVTGYGPPLELRPPPLHEVLEAIKRAGAILGPDRIAWRYDPVILGTPWTPDWHRRTFSAIARALEGTVERVVVSLLDLYGKTRRALGNLLRSGAVDAVQDPSSEQALATIAGLVEVAGRHGMRVQSCAEGDVWQHLGVEARPCIDPAWLEERAGVTVRRGRDKGQRGLCRCAPSRDIGAYDTCSHGCLYCYATSARAAAAVGRVRYDPTSLRLVGTPRDDA